MTRIPDIELGARMWMFGSSRAQDNKKLASWYNHLKELRTLGHREYHICLPKTHKQSS